MKNNHYDNIQLHRQFIADDIRNKAYKKAIKKINPRNKLVLDAGCGLGIISYFFAYYGAKKVIAVDRSNIIKIANTICQQNKYSDKIFFKQTDLRKLNQSTQFNIIAHTSNGYFLFNEDTVRIVSYLRKRYLLKNGIILPEKIHWKITPVNFHKTKYEKDYSPTFWEINRYGINWSYLTTKDKLHPKIINLTNEETYLSKPELLYELDYYSIETIPEVLQVQFNINKSGYLSGFINFFNIFLYQDIYIDTSPVSPSTLWQQSFFPLDKIIKVKKEEKVIFILYTKKSPDIKKWQYKLLF